MDTHAIPAAGTFTLLAAPAHDDFTTYSSALLVDFPSLGTATALRVFAGALTYKNFLKEQNIKAGTDVMLIFCGHGTDFELLGPALPGTSDETSDFYNETHLRLGPRFMLAFCCNAGKGLGAEYHSKTTMRAFVGFNDKLYMVTAEGEYAFWWRKLMHSIALAIMTTVDKATLEKNVRDAYRSALAAFPAHEDDQRDYGFMMRAYLRRQLENLVVVVT